MDGRWGRAGGWAAGVALAAAGMMGVRLVRVRGPEPPRGETPPGPVASWAAPSEAGRSSDPAPRLPLAGGEGGVEAASPPPTAVPLLAAAAGPVSPLPGEAGPGVRAVPLRGHPERVRRLLRWAEADPAAAVLWADRLPDPARREEALQAVCFKVAERDPQAAVDMAETFGLESPGVVENLVAQWAATDSDAALRWIAQQPPGESTDELVSRVAFALAASAPAYAARLVEDGMPPGWLQAEAAASVAHRWALQDPAAAAEWTEGLPEGSLRERARRELASLGAPPR